MRLLGGLLLGTMGIGIVEPAPFEIFGILLLVLYAASNRFRLAPRTLFLCLVFLGASYGAALLNAGRVPMDHMLRHVLVTTALVLCALGYAQHLKRTTEFEVGIAACTLAVVAVLGILLNEQVVAQFAKRVDAGRVIGFQKDANIFGSGCLWLIALGLALGTAARSGLTRLSWHGVTAVGLAGVYLSGSRGSVVGMFITIAVVFACAVQARLGRRPFTVVAVVALALGAAVLVTGAGATPWSEGTWATRAGLQAYDESRFLYQGRAAVEILEHPLGSGPNASLYVWGHSVHNSYLQVVFERGWLAFFAWMALLFGCATALLRYLRAQAPSLRSGSSGRWALAVAGLAVLASILVQAMVVDVLHWRSLWLCFALGLAAVAWRQQLGGSSVPARATPLAQMSA